MQKISQVNLSDKYVVNMGVQLGKGSTGSVYEGRDLRKNSTVAVKVIELASIDNEVTQYLLEMEKKALMSIAGRDERLEFSLDREKLDTEVPQSLFSINIPESFTEY